MTSERAYLLTRCLRLEAKIAVLKDELAKARPRRALTPADRAAMVEMRRQGKPVRAIANQTGWSVGTVYNVTNALQQLGASR
jgi:uncharacterized protein YerC